MNLNLDEIARVRRVQRRYRRAVNGGWLGDAPETTDTREVRLGDLRGWVVGDGWLEVTFPDGAVESIFGADYVGGRPYSYHPRCRALLARA